MFNLFIASPGGSACKHASSGAVRGGRSPGQKARPWLCAQLVEAVLPSPAGRYPQPPGGRELCPLLYLLPPGFPAALTQLWCHSGVTPVSLGSESPTVIAGFWPASMSSSAVILIRLFSHVCCTLCCYCCSDLSLIRKPVYLTATSCSKGFVLVPLAWLGSCWFTIVSLCACIALGIFCASSSLLKQASTLQNIFSFYLIAKWLCIKLVFLMGS